MFLEGADGDYVDERRSVEHPRISHTQVKRGDLTATVFRVDGLPADYLTFGQALEALRLNPLPGDIVAVPPMMMKEAAC